MSKVKNRLIVGLTGGIGTGKSEVLKLLRRRGIACVSSDDLAHACIAANTSGQRSIVRAFGTRMQKSTGEIDRKRLAALVFDNPAARKKLERIVHPCVIRGLRRFVAGKRGLLVLDIPLLYEARLRKLVDAVLCVTSKPQQQISRVMQRSGWTRLEVVSRMQAQWPVAKKAKRSDWAIDNSGPRRRLNRLVGEWLEAVRQGSALD